MPVKETKGKQLLGAKFLVIIAKPFHRRLKRDSAQQGPTNAERSDSK
jgi:hypothetical protein